MYTQKILSLLTALFLFFGVTAVSQATLINNGDGTVTQIRIDGSRLMWLQDANYAQTSGYDADGLMTWSQANSWIASLNTAGYLGYNDWRLPTTPGTGTGYLNEGEMGHLYYDEGVTFATPSPFTSVQSHFYWSGTEYAPNPTNAWVFGFYRGRQDNYDKGRDHCAWAVRPAAVPEPGTLFLLGTGLSGMAFLRKRARRLQG